MPLNLIQRWMGHARMHTTAIYAAVCGPEELTFARQFWRAATSRQENGRSIKPPDSSSARASGDQIEDSEMVVQAREHIHSRAPKSGQEQTSQKVILELR